MAGCEGRSQFSLPLNDVVTAGTYPDKFKAPVCTSNGQTTTRVPRKEGFKSLGCWIYVDDSYDKELEHRFAAARKAFCKCKHIFCFSDSRFTNKVAIT